MRTLACLRVFLVFGFVIISRAALAQDPISTAAINAADVAMLVAHDGTQERPYIVPPSAPIAEPDAPIKELVLPNPAIVRVQVLLSEQHDIRRSLIIEDLDGLRPVRELRHAMGGSRPSRH